MSTYPIEIIENHSKTLFRRSWRPDGTEIAEVGLCIFDGYCLIKFQVPGFRSISCVFLHPSSIFESTYLAIHRSPLALTAK
jgi:hypothetical protein